MPAQPTRTLTQRRTAVPPVESNLTSPPPPMAPTTNLINSDAPKPEGSNSLVKIIIWGVVVLLIAAAAYLLLNNVLSGEKTPEVTTTPTPTVVVEEEPETIDASKLDSSLAEDAPEDSDFEMVDQTVGAESEDEFTIESYTPRSYDRFFRFEFEVSSSGEEAYPLVEATYNADGNSIDLEFNGIVEDNTELDFEVAQEIDGSVVSSITKRATSEENVAKYTIGITEDVGYYLHLLDEPNRVVIDVQETEDADITPTPTEVPDDIDDDTDSGEKPTETTLTNEFSKNDQWIVTSLTGNTVTTPKYAFGDLGTFVKITYDLSGGLPNVEAKLDGTTLTIVMSNRITSNKTATIEINNGNVTTVDVVSSGNTTTYTVHLVKEADYRIYVNEAPAQFIIEVKD